MQIPKYARGVASGKFFVLPCIRKKLPVAGSVDKTGIYYDCKVLIEPL